MYTLIIDYSLFYFFINITNTNCTKLNLTIYGFKPLFPNKQVSGITFLILWCTLLGAICNSDMKCNKGFFQLFILIKHKYVQ